MKKWIVWVAAGLALCLLVVGTFVIIELTKNPNVGLCLADSSQGEAITQALEEAKLVVHSGEVTMEQVQLLSESSAVIFAQLSAPDQAAALEQKAGNVPVVFLGCRPEDETMPYIGGDSAQAGQVLGQLLLAQPNRGDWNEDGLVTCLLVGAEIGRSDMAQWAAAITGELGSAGLEADFVQIPGLAFARQTGKEVCSQALASYGKDLEAVLVCTDGALYGALEALEEGGRIPGRNVTLLGAGHSSQVADMVQEGTISGYAYIEEASFCQAVVDAALLAQRGKTPETVILEYTQVLAQ